MLLWINLLLFVPAVLKQFGLEGMLYPIQGMDATSEPTSDMLSMVLSAIPHIIGAALILFIIYYNATFASSLLTGFLASLGFNQLPEKIGFKPLVKI
tara:strand:- start:944 stop:1234 length:291 start_codon:yes stop_codon:yes gene_type:complete